MTAILDPLTRQKWDQLIQWMQSYTALGVALSGVVDSAEVFAAAADAIGVEHVKAFSIRSPMEPQNELRLATATANYLGVEQFVMDLNELEDERIRLNPKNRCYYCKLIRLEKIRERAKEYHIESIVDGSNADDEHDYRPGRQALKEMQVASPLAINGISKQMVRELAKWRGLTVWNKPSTPCLASRFPYGVAIDQQRINQVACAEAALINLGFETVRVRYHGETARIEVPQECFNRIFENREAIMQQIQQCGFKTITLDLQGFRSGSLNEGII
ncbi:MAG TPA: ATP-dependent sacrificial sulfur transferase LarE [Anaerolineaceae bacterium]|nr:ATP-dependent sacrificial sulfur transferase LarE [Anaerolineaceae bacterium]